MQVSVCVHYRVALCMYMYEPDYECRSLDVFAGGPCPYVHVYACRAVSGPRAVRRAPRNSPQATSHHCGTLTAFQRNPCLKPHPISMALSPSVRGA